jgi:hypothetical protein
VSLPASGSLAVVRTSSPGKNFLRNQLCISEDNNPELGRFFADPKDGGVVELNKALALDTNLFYHDVSSLNVP